MLTSIATTLSVAACAGLLGGDGSPVSFERGPDRLAIRVDGRPFAVYIWNDPAIRRPFFAHVRSPGGVPITRNHPPIEGRDATDHATMHPGVWLAFGDINGTDFWRNVGVVEQAGFVEEPRLDPDGGRFAVRNRYLADGRLVCEELRRIRIRTTPRGTRIDWRSEFTGPAPFAFGDQEEMGLGVRVATDRIVTRGGAITDSEGRTNEREIWGRAADWCDYSNRQAGILLMPDPANFRRSWFHVRDYGLMVANPFGRQALTRGEPSRVEVAPGTTFTLGFRLIVHDGAIDGAAAYREFAESGGPE